MSTRIRMSLTAALAAACALVPAGVARAASAGSLDTSFGSNGSGYLIDQWGQSAPAYSQGFAVAIGSDGSPVIAGFATDSSGNYQASIARYMSSGNRDTGFGSASGPNELAGGGGVLVPFGTNGGSANAVALDAPTSSSTEYWLAGTDQANSPQGDFFLAKVEHNGQLDTGFNGNGIQSTGPSAFAIPAAQVSCPGCAVASLDASALYHYTSGALSGDTLLVGTAQINDGDSDIALARYKPTGALDTSFNTTGTELVTFDSGSTQSPVTGDAVFVDPGSGTILTVGQSNPGGGPPEWAAARLRSAGAVDATFGTGGVQSYQVGAAPGCTSPAPAGVDSVVPDGSGGYILGGCALSGSNNDFALLHVNSSGSPVNSWGPNGNGQVLTAVGSASPANSAIHSMVVSLDGSKLIAAGDAQDDASPQDSDFAIARYNMSDGSLDSSFGSGGITTTSILGGSDHAGAESVAIDPTTGNPVVAGYAILGYGTPSSSTEVALARYLANGTAGGGGVPVADPSRPPTVNGPSSPVVGDTFTASSPGGWSGSPDGYTYTWLRCSPPDTNPADCTAVQKSSAVDSYTTTTNGYGGQSDVGHYFLLQVVAHNSAGFSQPASAAVFTGTVQAVPSVPVNTSPPTVGGPSSPVVGDTFTVASNGIWSGGPTNFTYVWLRCNPPDNRLDDCVVAQTGTSPNYATTTNGYGGTSDAGHYFMLQVIAQNAAGSSQPASASVFTGIVQAAPVNTGPPVIAIWGQINTDSTLAV